MSDCKAAKTIQGNLHVTGKLTVDGLIDPTGVLFSPAPPGQSLGLMTSAGLPPGTTIDTGSPPAAPPIPTPHLPPPNPPSIANPIPFKAFQEAGVHDSPSNQAPLVDVVPSLAQVNVIDVTIDPVTGAVFYAIDLGGGQVGWIARSDPDNPGQLNLGPVNEAPEPIVTVPVSEPAVLPPTNAGEVDIGPNGFVSNPNDLSLVQQAFIFAATQIGAQANVLLPGAGADLFAAATGVALGGLLGDPQHDVVPLVVFRPGNNNVSLNGPLEIANLVSGTRSQFAGALIRSIDAEGGQTNVSGSNIQIADKDGTNQVLGKSTAVIVTGPGGQSSMMASGFTAISPTGQTTQITGGNITTQGSITVTNPQTGQSTTITGGGGPAPGASVAMIPFASGDPCVLTMHAVPPTNPGGAVVGFGIELSDVDLTTGTVDLTGTPSLPINMAMSLPKNGTLDALTLFYSNIGAPGDLVVPVGSVLHLVGQIYKSQNNLFAPIPGALVDIVVPGGTTIPVGGTLRGKIKNINQAVTDDDRILLVVSANYTGGAPFEINATGYVSAGLSLAF